MSEPTDVPFWVVQFQKDVHDKLDTFKTQVNEKTDKVGDKIGNLDTKVSGLKAQVSEGFKAFDTRFTIGEDHQAQVDDKLEELGKKVDDKLGALDKKLDDKTSQTQAQISEKVGGVYRKMDTLCKDCEGVKASQRNGAEIQRIRGEIGAKKVANNSKKRWLSDRKLAIMVVILTALGILASFVIAYYHP